MWSLPSNTSTSSAISRASMSSRCPRRWGIHTLRVCREERSESIRKPYIGSPRIGASEANGSGSPSSFRLCHPGTSVWCNVTWNTIKWSSLPHLSNAVLCLNSFDRLVIKVLCSFLLVLVTSYLLLVCQGYAYRELTRHPLCWLYSFDWCIGGHWLLNVQNNLLWTMLHLHSAAAN